jgi:hypothetical protein
MKKLVTVTLLLLLLSVTSCDMLGNLVPTPTSPTQPSNPNDGDNEPSNPQNGPKNHYSDYENFNPADYPILNESGKPDSEIAELKDWIWLMYAENEDVGEWTANRVKSNKIKTILSGGSNYGNWAWGWMWPDNLDRFYLNAENFSDLLSAYKECDDFMRYYMRKQWYGILTHENMHIVQYSTDFIKQMTGMRPDICAAIKLLTEFLPAFYTDYYPHHYVSVDMENAVATQSKYMIWATDPWSYDDHDMSGENPSNPPLTYWFNNELSTYAQSTFTTVGGIAMTPPLKQASKEDILKVARTLLACRDPKQAGVTDDALWTVIDALRKAAIGDKKYLRLSEDGVWSCRQDVFDNFQEFIAEWDAAYAAQARSVNARVSKEPSDRRSAVVTNLAAAIVW